MSRTRFQKVVTLVSVIAFFGSTAYGAIGALSNALKPPADVNTAVSPETQLQVEAKGYEMVLKREPENRVALEGLVLTRLKMKDAKSAIAPLEKLVKLNLTRQDYKTVLTQVKKQVKASDRNLK